MSDLITYKPWDSNFFGFKTGDLAFMGTAAELNIALQQFKHDGYQLIYWKIEDSNQHNLNVAEELHLFKGDVKVSYSFEINEPASLLPIPYEIKLWQGSITDGLIKLGIESGRYSRFKKDPEFPAGSFERMYAEWIKQSISGSMGDEIYYIGEPENIKAFITLSYTASQAEIGLIGVDAQLRNQGYGTALINFVKNQTLLKKLPLLIVATQMQNNEACCLYEKCKGKINSIHHIYHIHL